MNVLQEHGIAEKLILAPFLQPASCQRENHAPAPRIPILGQGLPSLQSSVQAGHTHKKARKNKMFLEVLSTAGWEKSLNPALL